MSEAGNQPHPKVHRAVSEEDRARLHIHLDKLLDEQNTISAAIGDSPLSPELATKLQARSKGLARKAIHFGAEVVGAKTRAIAFAHSEPSARTAFSNFLSIVSEFAAPSRATRRQLDFSTFALLDAHERLRDLMSLDFGCVPECFRPSKTEKPVRTRFDLLMEQLRAAQWVFYVKGGAKMDAAINEVATAYEVSERSIYDWIKRARDNFGHEAAASILESAETAGAHFERPTFTLAPVSFDCDDAYPDWLRHDAEQYKTMENQSG